MNLNELLEVAKKAAIAGGQEILKVYEGTIEVDYKEDKSPLTQADKEAHLAIESFLLETGVPILSEEGKEIPYEERRAWEYLWIVDPLDGTKEFIKRNGEFTVNIALVKNGEPIMGVIYVPVKGVLYFASDSGSFKVENDKQVQLPSHTNKDVYKVVGSRSHMSQETEDYLDVLKKEHENVEMVSMGSSLKICLVAEGIANEYPRFAPLWSGTPLLVMPLPNMLERV